MFYDYALIPDIFDPDLLYCDAVSELALTQLLDGISDNGMIAALHKGELRARVGELVSCIPDEDPEQGRKSPRKDIERCLALLDSRNRFVRHPVSPNGVPQNNTDWLNLALESNQRMAFDGIVVGDDLYASARLDDSAQASTLRTSLQSSFWRSRQRDITVTKRKGDFERAVGPILRHAKSVTLIDPYIDPRVSRWLHIIDLVGTMTGNRGWAQPSTWQPRS